MTLLVRSLSVSTTFVLIVCHSGTNVNNLSLAIQEIVLRLGKLKNEKEVSTAIYNI